MLFKDTEKFSKLVWQLFGSNLFKKISFKHIHLYYDISVIFQRKYIFMDLGKPTKIVKNAERKNLSKVLEIFHIAFFFMTLKGPDTIVQK